MKPVVLQVAPIGIQLVFEPELKGAIPWVEADDLVFFRIASAFVVIHCLNTGDGRTGVATMFMRRYPAQKHIVRFARALRVNGAGYWTLETATRI